MKKILERPYLAVEALDPLPEGYRAVRHLLKMREGPPTKGGEEGWHKGASGHHPLPEEDLMILCDIY